MTKKEKFINFIQSEIFEREDIYVEQCGLGSVFESESCQE